MGYQIKSTCRVRLVSRCLFLLFSGVYFQLRFGAMLQSNPMLSVSMGITWPHQWPLVIDRYLSGSCSSSSRTGPSPIRSVIMLPYLHTAASAPLRS